MDHSCKPELYQFTDYRVYLREWFEHFKTETSYMSFRYLSRRTGIDAGYLANIFQGNKHLSDAGIASFSDLMKLDPKETRYFQAMVHFGKARSETEIRERFEKMMILREASARVLQQQEYRYWVHWYTPAIRLTLLTHDFRGDFAALARRITPAISAQQAQESIELLLSLGFVKIREDGVYEVQDAHLSSGDAWTSAAIREFQAETLQLARESIRTQPPELREISTLTVAIPKEEIVALQEMMRDFRSRVAKWAVSMNHSDYVLQLNLCCFPVSVPDGGDQS